MGQYHKIIVGNNESVNMIRPEMIKMMEFSWMGNNATLALDLMMYHKKSSSFSQMREVMKYERPLETKLDPYTGVKVLTVGDYGENKEITKWFKEAHSELYRKAVAEATSDSDGEYSEDELNFYTLAYGLQDPVDIGDLAGLERGKEFNSTDFYKMRGLVWVNHTKKLYLPVEQYLSDFTKAYQLAGLLDPKKGRPEYIPYPITLLTSESNGLGGGDYRLPDTTMNKWVMSHVGSWLGDELSMEIIDEDTAIYYDGKYERLDLFFVDCDEKHNNGIEYAVSLFKEGKADEFRLLKELDGSIMDNGIPIIPENRHWF